MSRSILVTGGTGFIGRALIPVLLSGNNTVHITGRNIDRDRYPDSRNTKYFHLDLDKISGISPEMLDNVDTVVHLAARVHIMGKGKPSLDEYRHTNTEGTRRLAEAAEKAGVRRFIFLSTVKVHGERTSADQNGSHNRFTEDDALAPEDDYAVSKQEAEKALVDVCKSAGMEYTIFRPPLVYGPGVKANFYRLLALVYKRYPLPFSLLENQRSMLFAGNLADVISHCIDNDNAANQAFLIRDVDVTMKELVTKAGEYLGKPARLFPVSERLLKIIGKIVKRESTIERLTEPLLVDDTRIRNRLTWSPPHTFDDGLKKTVDWFRKTMEQGK